MLLDEVLSLVLRAEEDTGGAELCILIGEVLARELCDEQQWDALPERINGHRVNPWLWTARHDHVYIHQAPVRIPGQGDWAPDVLDERVVVSLSPGACEAYSVLRGDGVPPETAYDVAEALDD